jgi:hypothetical protein
MKSISIFEASLSLVSLLQCGLLDEKKLYSLAEKELQIQDESGRLGRI